MKKVLVTGSSGFLGSHIVDALSNNGLDVVLFDSKKSNYKQQGQKEFIGDIRSFDDVSSAISGCKYVFHYAAQADIGLSNIDPVETIQRNINGTQNLLEVIRKQKIKRLVFASTIYVYSELGSFYRVSKQACEKLIEEYNKQFSVQYTILRYGSLYGPRANKFNFINNMLNQAIKHNKIERQGNGEEIREYIHVRDAAKISLKALNEKYNNSHLIISGNQSLKVKDMLKMVKEIFQNKIKIIYLDDTESYHYNITPYNYRPRIAKKITSESYHDLGQGLMDLIYEIKSKNESF